MPSSVVRVDGFTKPACQDWSRHRAARDVRPGFEGLPFPTPPLNITLVGYGRMGRAVEVIAVERGHHVVARVDLGDQPDFLGPAAADVAIEFTQPEAAADNAKRIAEAGMDLVVGTTGWYHRLDEVASVVERAGTGLLYAPNFSLGVHILFRMASRLGGLVSALDEYDVHVHEEHHRHKVDHPSGTARHLAEILVETLAGKTQWREGPSEGVPDPSTLWVSSARAGEIPGTHTIAVEGPDDRIELRHEARTRSGFARGAVTAAEWIHGRSGVYSVEDMLMDLFGEATPKRRDDQ